MGFWTLWNTLFFGLNTALYVEYGVWISLTAAIVSGVMVLYSLLKED